MIPFQLIVLCADLKLEPHDQESALEHRGQLNKMPGQLDWTNTYNAFLSP